MEEMRLRRVEPRPDRVARLADEAARRAGAEKPLADLEVDDVVGAERLDDVRLDRHEAGRVLPADHDAFGPDPDGEIGLGIACRSDARAELLREIELLGAPEKHPGVSAV